MDDILYNQIRVLIVFNITGIIIGLIFDFFRAQRRAIKTINFITYIQDVLFWILSGIVIIISAITYTNGEIRSYMVLGLIVGVVFYFTLLSKYVLSLASCIANYMIKLVSYITSFIFKWIKIMFSPITKLFNYLKKVIIKQKTLPNNKKILEKE
ncbi:MAG: spore cortex biosynthesis protein YabQ [Clostridia bacterium]|nr:spore cortex biosynthesis protein YabQ [Clostridia bacterium]